MLTRVFVSSCAAVLCASGAASADWNASADFSATHNPNGAWSYGTRTTLEGVGLVPLSDQFTVSTISGWNVATNQFPVAPGVFKNFGADQDFGFAFPGGRLGMHPGDVNNGSAADRSVVVVRWTAPEEGLFTVAGAFYGMDRGDKHVAIVHDGLLIGEAVIAGSVDATFNFDAFVAAGGVLDFVVENNGVFDFDTTGLDVNISPVPTPGCAALLSIGGLAAFRRRRN